MSNQIESKLLVWADFSNPRVKWAKGIQGSKAIGISRVEEMIGPKKLESSQILGKTLNLLIRELYLSLPMEESENRVSKYSDLFELLNY